MKFCFENADALKVGIETLIPELGIVLADASEADVVVFVKETDEDIVTVTRDGRRAEIVYGGGKARFFRGLATLAGFVREGALSETRTEHPLFLTNGAMVDMSRNAVMNLKTVKSMMRKMALMGMNMYMLYTEDTYEIEGYPYFGYMRGRYTKAELKALDAYALSLGIELIPCIQVLGHLATMLRWESAKPMKDTSGVLLVDSDATYALIDAMLKTASECFTSRRIHLGMDETHDLGTGTFLDRNGYEERYKIFLRHLARVSEMARGYGFSPMMWSDMFFRLSAKGMKGYGD
ncbi:MAG: family 20 glycosylhydrolase, partial [Clostridia bacterium]|nr:family 20 glycosylhydrolase [Clostridia bacterium]